MYCKNVVLCCRTMPLLRKVRRGNRPVAEEPAVADVPAAAEPAGAAAPAGAEAPPAAGHACGASAPADQIPPATSVNSAPPAGKTRGS